MMSISGLVGRDEGAELGTLVGSGPKEGPKVGPIVGPKDIGAPKVEGLLLGYELSMVVDGLGV